MKRLLLCVMALFLCGCSALYEESAAQNLPELSSSIEVGQLRPQVINPALYFVDRETGWLAVEVRELVVPEEMHVPAVAVEALLAGPRSDALELVQKGLRLDRVETSQDVANVYLRYDKTLGDKVFFTLACSITNTLTDYFKMTYVNVFVNDAALCLRGIPVGALRKMDNNVEAQYQEYDLRYTAISQQSIAFEADVVLYYICPSKKYMLTEGHKISFTKETLMQRVIEELSQGAQYKQYVDTAFSLLPGWSKFFSYSYYAGTGTLRLEFGQSSLRVKEDETQTLAFATLFYSLAGVLPRLSTLHIQTDGQTYTLTREDVAGLLGERVTIYLSDSAMDFLVGVERTVPASEPRSLEARLYEMIEGPSSADAAEVWPTMPEGVTWQDVLGIQLDGSTAIINFTEHFSQSMQGLSQERVKLCVYSIINSLSEDVRVSSVLFLVEGGRIATWGGELDLSYPLMRNPGLIQRYVAAIT